ncbi:MAG: hypothetical protein KAR20_12705 [Candidatus Heimdallarchaeota archaeon]|nr:hypothetical protein [Candidatus Heimdallarchaeota archaeon]
MGISKEYLEQVSQKVQDMLPDMHAFAIVVAEFDDDGEMRNFQSSSNGIDSVKAELLRKLADQVEEDGYHDESDFDGIGPMNWEDL